jgi:hypothetical protein
VLLGGLFDQARRIDEEPWLGAEAQLELRVGYFEDAGGFVSGFGACAFSTA